MSVKFRREFYPAKGSDWVDRTVIVWMEDDARPPDAECVSAAYKRITGSKYPEIQR